MKRLIAAALLILVLITVSVPSALAEEPIEENPNIIPSHVYVTVQPGGCLVIEKTVVVNPPNPGVNPVPPVSGEFEITPEIYLPALPIDVEFTPMSKSVYVNLESGEFPKIVFNEKICAPPGTPYGYYESTIVFPVTADNGYSDNLGKQVIHVSVSPPGSRTHGFYMNHPCVIEQVLEKTGAILLGEDTVENVSVAVETLNNREDPLDRLASQLLTTKLNDRSFGIGNCTLNDLGLEGAVKVKEIMKTADEILIAGSTDKDYISKIQDLLDEINNSNCSILLPQWVVADCV